MNYVQIDALFINMDRVCYIEPTISEGLRISFGDESRGNPAGTVVELTSAQSKRFLDYLDFRADSIYKIT